MTGSICSIPRVRIYWLKLVRAYEDVIWVEVLTFCMMDNHFHLLVRVPRRPEGFDVPLEVVVARFEFGSGAGGGIGRVDAPESGVLADDGELGGD